MQEINDRLHADLLEISGAFDCMIGEYLGHVLTRHLPADRWEKAPEVHPTHFPVDRLDLPFFLARPEARVSV